MKNRYLILLVTLIFLSCRGRHWVSIESINAIYYNMEFTTVESIGCDEIIPTSIKCDTFGNEAGEIEFTLQHGILDTTIIDKKVLEEITNEIPFFKKEKNYGIDARMKCYINFSNGHTDSLCIDQNPVYGYYNNEPMRFTNKFVYLIRKNCGFYQWIYIKGIRSFEELNDTTFVREKVISSTGEEY